MFFFFLFFNFSFSAEDENVEKNPFIDSFDSEQESEFYTYTGNKNENHLIQYEKEGENTVVKLTWVDGTAGPGEAVYLESYKRFTYGHLSARFKNPDSSSQPNAGVVSSLFMIFNPDQFSDIDNDGIMDTAEIDLEFLAAAPKEIHITSHVNYQDGDNNERISKNINIETGEILFFRHIKAKDGKETIENMEAPEIKPIPGYSNTNFNVFGIDYFRTKLRIWIENDGEKVVLFEIDKGIPQYPMYIDANVWWTDNWYPGDQKEAVEKPTFNPSLVYDWIKWDPCTEEEEELYNKIPVDDNNNNDGDNNNDDDDNDDEIVKIVVPVVVVLVVVIAIGIVVAVIVYKKRKAKQNVHDMNP